MSERIHGKLGKKVGISTPSAEKSRSGATCKGTLSTSRKQLRHMKNGVMPFRVFVFIIACVNIRCELETLETFALT